MSPTMRKSGEAVAVGSDPPSFPESDLRGGR